MAQEAPARTKIPTKSPQPARGRAARRAKAGRTAHGRMLAGGTGRAATRGGGPVIELECGITVYPAREEQGRTGTPELDRIEHVTSAYPDRCFAFGQFGPLSIRPCHGACWARREHPVRLRMTYHRTHGIRYFHGCCCVGDDQLRGVTRGHKGAVHTLAAAKSIRASRPGGYRLFVILGNLAADKTPAIRRWARRENAGLCLTPTNASWANPIEAHFGPVRTFVMGTSGHPDHPALARRLQACLRWRNAHARHPGVLAAQRRERARIRSERQQRWGRPRPKAA